MLTVSRLFVYPVKSFGGIEVSSAMLTDRGFQHDRRWMLVDEQNRFISQREVPELALLQPCFFDDGIRITHKISAEEVVIPFTPQTNEQVFVNIWDDMCMAQIVSNALNECFSKILSLACKLVYMPDATKRKVDINYAYNNELTTFSDGYPLLVIGEPSMNLLNSKLPEPLPIERFRPNIVFTGGLPHEEDILEHFTINDINFYGVKPCARCSIPTINQDTAIKGKQPSKTLATYRVKNKNIYFGQNLLYDGIGEIKVGDVLNVKKKAMQSFL